MKEFPSVNDFEIPAEFRIEGCYIRSMNSLMEASEGYKEEVILQKLLEFRENIEVDIN
jgi:hypothetical protein